MRSDAGTSVSSRRGSFVRSGSDDRRSDRSQLPSCSSADRIASKLPSASTSRSSTRQFDVAAIPSIVCSPTYRAVPRLPTSRYDSPARRLAVRYRQSGHSRPPGDDVVHPRAVHRENRIWIDPQGHVGADRQQHHQMPHPRPVVEAVLVDRCGLHELPGRAQALQQVRPGVGQLGHLVVPARQRRLRDRVRQPRQVFFQACWAVGSPSSATLAPSPVCSLIN